MSKEPAAFFTDKKDGLLYPSPSLSDPSCSSFFSDVRLNLTGRIEISIKKDSVPNYDKLKLSCIPLVEKLVDTLNVSVKKPANAKSILKKIHDTITFVI